MNPYCLHKIRQFQKKYLRREFDQDDVVLFLVLVRDYVEKNTIFRELGDFLAHPDKKDRGMIIRSINEMIVKFDDYCLTMSEDALEKCIFEGISCEDVARHLQKIFEAHGMEMENISVSDLEFRDFIFCLVFILGNFRLDHGGRTLDLTITYGHGLKLTTVYENEVYFNHKALLTVLFLGNVWIDYIGSDDAFPSGPELSGFVARRLDSGVLIARSFEDDLDNAPLKEFIRGRHWPLPDFEG
jgi:hypothetical protein